MVNNSLNHGQTIPVSGTFVILDVIMYFLVWIICLWYDLIDQISRNVIQRIQMICSCYQKKSSKHRFLILQNADEYLMKHKPLGWIIYCQYQPPDSTSGLQYCARVLTFCTNGFHRRSLHTFYYTLHTYFTYVFRHPNDISHMIQALDECGILTIHAECQQDVIHLFQVDLWLLWHLGMAFAWNTIDIFYQWFIGYNNGLSYGGVNIFHHRIKQSVAS